MQQERWGSLDTGKKRPRNPSREDGSMDGMDEEWDEPERRVRFCEVPLTHPWQCYILTDVKLADYIRRQIYDRKRNRGDPLLIG